MARRPAKWSVPIAKVMEEIKADHRQLAIGTGFELFRLLITRSPVGAPETWKHKPPAGYVGGAFRGNWMIGTKEEPQGFNVNNKDATGSKALADASASLLQFSLGDTIMMRNNAPYGPRLEFEGWSSQAPSGLVRITASEGSEVVRSVGAGLVNKYGEA